VMTRMNVRSRKMKARRGKTTQNIRLTGPVVAPPHSKCRASTGFVRADFRVCRATVSQEMTRAAGPATLREE
jgi:hypothetical protein